ncbi:MAG: type II toxin-antitoxin system Phd/YefM family antitoxin [Gammaproteobacteria bacterium]
MKTINIHEAKTHLSQIIERVARGESVIIGKAGKPMAVLSPYAPTVAPRAAGSMKGKIHLADDFEADSDLIADLFEGKAKSK